MKLRNVWIIEDDFYSSDMMLSLLTRDWRTHVIEHTYDYQRSVDYLHSRDMDMVHYVLLDVETYSETDPDWPYKLLELIKIRHPDVVVIATCSVLSVSTIRRVLKAGFDGLLRKGEIRYAIAAATCAASHDHWIATPSIVTVIKSLPAREVPKKIREISFMFGDPPYSVRAEEIMRLVAFFGQTSAEVAHELGLADGYVRRVVSGAYKDLHIDADAGLDWVYIRNKLKHDALTDALYEDWKESKKAAKALLAFYLLTAPEHILDHKVHVNFH